jgi:hypothetical protein
MGSKTSLKDRIRKLVSDYPSLGKYILLLVLTVGVIMMFRSSINALIIAAIEPRVCDVYNDIIVYGYGCSR